MGLFMLITELFILFVAVLALVKIAKVEAYLCSIDRRSGR